MNLYERAVKAYGADKQIEQVIEECAELIMALQKIKRFPDALNYWENVHEEIADVELMINQMKYIFNSEKIEEYKNKKIKRLEDKLDGK